MHRFDPERLDYLFHRAVSLDPSERDQFLVNECSSEPDLMEFVQTLLAADSATYTFVNPVGALAPPSSSSSSSSLDGNNGFDSLAEGTMVGAYRILRELGRGGMGTVFLAERSDGQYQQLVAIKVIHAGLGDRSLVNRFQRERQILARLSHPAIATLFDGGVTPDQRPYLVMEYVEGEPITDYCERNALSLRRRLELFVEVCGAVQEAHRSLIVHRDIKPSNILVTAAGRPKLLDFGIAKILSDNREDDGADTKTGLAFTPDYASPEQVRGEPVGTPTDVYLLGALLFELVTGRRTFVSGTSPFEKLRAVTQDDPPRPSEVAIRQADRRGLRGDVDRIILHALEKDPHRRYPSVDAMAADTQRYLAGFPVQARGASLVYRAGKFVRRNRTWVAAALAVFVLGALGLARIVRSERVASAERDRAERRFREVRELANSYVFEFDSKLAAIPGTTKVRTQMNHRSLVYLDRLLAEAAGDTALQRELANAYTKLAVVQGVPIYANIGDSVSAVASIEKAIGLRRMVLSANPGSTEDQLSLASTILTRGYISLAAGDPEAALKSHSEAMRLTEGLLAGTSKPSGRLLNVTVSALEAVAGDYGGNGYGAHTGNPVAALPLLERAMELTIQEGEVREHEPDAAARNLYRYSNQAVVELLRGRLESQELRHGAMEVSQRFDHALKLLHTPGIDDKNAEIRRKVMVTQMWWAADQLDHGQVEQARTLLLRCREISSSLLQSDPENATARADDYVVRVLAAEADLRTGRQTDWTPIQRVLDAQSKLLEGDPERRNANELASEELRAARLALSLRRFDLARRWFYGVIDVAGRTVEKHGSDAKAQMDLAEARIGLAQVLSHVGGDPTAARDRELAVEALRQMLARHGENPRAKALLEAAREPASVH
jgi:tetratricopeptide (TPR) repeat protein